jgi:hypothetical protein
MLQNLHPKALQNSLSRLCTEVRLDTIARRFTGATNNQTSAFGSTKLTSPLPQSMSGAEGTSGYRAFTFEVSFRPSLDGQITESCPAPFAKIFRFALTPNQHYIPRRPVPQRGARAIVTDAGRDAVDTDGAEDDRRWRWTAKSCGPDAPTLESSFVGFSCETTVAKEPGHRGEHEGNR